MSDEEAAAFLAAWPTATVISINPDGLPLPAPVWFTSRGTDIFFTTMRKTQKAKNLLRDPRVVVQVEAGTRYRELRAVIVTGVAREATDEELAWFEADRATKYGGSRTDLSAAPAATQKHYDNPRVLFHVVPTKVKTWDNRKLRFDGD
jgi:PPOX class probable F420-dependent enzyme